MSEDQRNPGPDRQPVESESGTPDLGTEEVNPTEWNEPDGNRKPPEERDAITQPVEKYDARKIVTGEAEYTGDKRSRFPDLLEASVLRSSVAHGRVTSIDTSAAEEMDGVHAVLTPDSEVVPDRVYTSAGQGYPEPTPWDLRVLREKVRMVGDPIAAVAADTTCEADDARTAHCGENPSASRCRFRLSVVRVRHTNTYTSVVKNYSIQYIRSSSVQ